MKQLIILLAGAFLLTTSCVSTKQLKYLQTEKESQIRQGTKIAHPYDIKIQNDDLLYISLSSKDAELVEPFKNATQLGSTAVTSSNTNGFLVNNEGAITFPILGKIIVRGKSCSDISNAIEKMLIDGNYLKDPVVTTRLGNFKVTLVGEVANPGIKEITGNRITVLEAISMGGDMTAIGKRTNVKILREQDGEVKLHEVNLTKANIVNSPYYYLQQNDVVYVEPNKSISVKSSPWTTYLGVGGSVLSFILSIITLATVSK